MNLQEKKKNVNSKIDLADKIHFSELTAQIKELSNKTETGVKVLLELYNYSEILHEEFQEMKNTAGKLKSSIALKKAQQETKRARFQHFYIENKEIFCTLKIKQEKLNFLAGKKNALENEIYRQKNVLAELKKTREKTIENLENLSFTSQITSDEISQLSEKLENLQICGRTRCHLFSALSQKCEELKITLSKLKQAN